MATYKVIKNKDEPAHYIFDLRVKRNENKNIKLIVATKIAEIFALYPDIEAERIDLRVMAADGRVLQIFNLAHAFKDGKGKKSYVINP